MPDRDSVSMAGRGPLAGLRVLQMGGPGPVPFCGMVLSDLGATVISIERPANSAAAPDEVAVLTLDTLRRGQRRVAVDLKHPAGIELVLDLVRAADGLMEGFRPGVMERLGLAPDVCLAVNPRLVYGRMTGWGQSGPYAGLPGHDINYLALAGALAPIGRHGQPPVPPLNLVADFGGGAMLLATGMLAALLEASRSGYGQVVDAAMLDGSALLMTMMYEMVNSGTWVETRGSNMNDSGAPFYDVYETADGKYVAIGAMERRFFDDLVRRIGLHQEDLPDQWDRSQWPILRGILASTFRQRTRDEWCELLETAPVCFTPVLELSEAPLHPHNQARQAFMPADGGPVPAPAPRFGRSSAPGEQTVPRTNADVLAEFGVTAERAARLRALGALA